MSKNCPVLSLVLHLHHEACWCSEFWKQFLTVIQGQKKLFTVIYPHALSASPTVGSRSTACRSTCVLDSLYTIHPEMMPQRPHLCCPGLQQVDCERSAASTIFSQRFVLNVQNRSTMQHFGRVRSVSCQTSCESVFHCLSAPLPESGHQAYTSSHTVNERTFFSSAKGVTLRQSPLSLAKNTKTWAPRQWQRQAICPQQPNIFLTSNDDDAYVDQSYYRFPQSFQGSMG